MTSLIATRSASPRSSSTARSSWTAVTTRARCLGASCAARSHRISLASPSLIGGDAAGASSLNGVASGAGRSHIGYLPRDSSASTRAAIRSRPVQAAAASILQNRVLIPPPCLFWLGLRRDLQLDPLFLALGIDRELVRPVAVEHDRGGRRRRIRRNADHRLALQASDRALDGHALAEVRPAPHGALRRRLVVRLRLQTTRYAVRAATPRRLTLYPCNL